VLTARLDRLHLLVLGGVAAVAALAWIDLWRRAGAMRMDGMAMGAVMPRQMAWDTADLATTAAMWAVMMIAMMLPSALPMLLLFSHAQRPRLGRPEGARRTALVAAGYVAVWVVWSALAAGLQWALQTTLLLSPGLTTTSAVLGGAILVVAGVYQFTPWKSACLAHCQSPLGFFLGHWRDGRGGALRMGVAHGAYCVGCCWALMGLLFVGGVMNLVWIAALAGFVLLEKAVARGRWLSYASGAVLVVWGGYVLRAGLGG
jgi:predicted metal-binding membrane protein